MQPAALTAFANALSSTGSGASSTTALDYEFLNTAEDYANQWVKLEGGAGGLIFSSIVPNMESLCTQTTNDYSIISGLLGSSARGLTVSAAQYRSQDRATAANLDSIYKPAGVTPLDTDEVDASAPTVDPASKLTPPGDDGAFPEFAEQILEAVAWGSRGISTSWPTPWPRMATRCSPSPGSSTRWCWRSSRRVRRSSARCAS